MDSLLVKKSDEEYDEMFGIVAALNTYSEEVLEIAEFPQAKGNIILQFIPVVYRNHLELIRQFVRYNVYNLKECRILFRCLYNARVN